jgi:hypothetical protein
MKNPDICLGSVSVAIRLSKDDGLLSTLWRCQQSIIFGIRVGRVNSAG